MPTLSCRHLSVRNTPKPTINAATAAIPHLRKESPIRGKFEK